MSLQIRCAKPADCEPLACLCAALWPDASVEEHAREIAPILEGRVHRMLPSLYLVAEVGGTLVGFAEVNLRSCADGCDPSGPVGYLEGWYVKEEYREKKIGSALLEAAENWARGQGCKEMASDTWIDNDLSQRVHEARGYEVVDRCIHYRKSL